MFRKKQVLISQETKPSEQHALSPAQKQRLVKLGERLSEKNRYKLEKNESAGNYHPAEPNKAMAILQAMEASGMADQDAASQLLGQVINAQPCPESLSNANAAVAMLQGIGPQDELEGMLAGQMVAVHNMAAEFSRRAMASNNSDAVDRYVSRAAKLMNVFVRQVEALQKYRTKGQQKIIVQHVQVSDGGQAIIGDVHQGGGTGG